MCEVQTYRRRTILILQKKSDFRTITKSFTASRIDFYSCDKEDTISSILAQVYRLSAVHWQMTRYSQRVPGYLIWYSVSANEISFDKKISQSDCVFQIRLGLEENDSPLHLVTSTGFLRPNWRIIQNMALKYVLFFLNDISLAPKM